jgi:chromosome segregation ATPase
VPWPAGTLQSSVAALELATGTLQEEIVDLKNAVDAALLGKEEAREQAAALEAQLSDSLSSKVELEEQASAIGKQLAQAQADADAARTRAEAAAGAARLRIVDLLRDGASNGELLTESRHAQMAFEAECSAALAKASALAWDCSTLQCLGGEREAMCAWLRGLLQKEREKLKSIEVVHLDAME